MRWTKFLRGGKPLDNGNAWQNRYIDGENAKAPELRFWLDAVPEDVK